jgi:hypothetical protein
MTNTPRLGLPLLASNQAQKHVTHNEALLKIDDIMQTSVLSRALSTPPGTPAEEDRYIVGDSATGLWSGEDKNLTIFRNGAWSFIAPWTGFTVFIEDEALLLNFDGSDYATFDASIPSELQELDLLGIGTTADATNPLAAKLNKALFTAKTVAEGGDGDLRYTLNKEAAADTVSFLFQTNYSGRAEIGLTGSDDFTLKTSPDGAAWTNALNLDKTTGTVTLAVDLPITEGGTGASTAAGARANLGLGSLATQSGTFSGTSSGTNTGDQTNISGNAATVTTNANLTGAVTSVGNATSLGSFTSAQLASALTDETGTGVSVFATSPTLVTPVLGVASASSIDVTGSSINTNGFYLPSANTVGLAAGGSQAFNTTSSLMSMATNLTAAKASPRFTFTNTSGTTTTIQMGADSGTAFIGTTTDHPFNLLKNNTTVATIQSANAQLELIAGTATFAPLKLTSGTNNTTAQAGAHEYDGTCHYLTSVASARQVAVAQQFVTVQGSDVSLSNSSTSAQNIFASANDVLSLAASTTYFFEGIFYVATGATSHTSALGLVASSAFTNIKYTSELWSTTSGTISTTAPSVLDVNASTATVLNTTSTAPLTTIRIKGIVRTNAASTITPQITFSAGPTGTCAVKVNSWFRLWPAGSNTVAAVGNWA